MVVGEFTTQVDVAVIGSGTAGLAAALEAARRGKTVALVTHGGGQRLAASTGPDLDACDAAGVTVVRGDAVFRDGRSLAIPDNALVPRLRFRRAVIAVDHEQTVPAWAAPVADCVISPWRLDPAADPVDGLTLVAGGSVADVAAALAIAGLAPDDPARVVLRVDERGLLPALDPELRDQIAARLAGRLTIDVSRGDPDVAAAADGVTVRPTDADDPERTAQRLVAAIDGPPPTDGLQLSATDVRTEGGAILVDGSLRTDDPRVFAAGSAVRIAGAAELTTDAQWAASGRMAAAGACGETGDWIDPRPSTLINFGGPAAHATAFAAWCGARPTDGDGIAWSTGEVRDANGHAWCRLGVDGASGLLVAAAAVADGPGDGFHELLLAVEMSAESADLAGVARPRASHLAAAIVLAAESAVASGDADVRAGQGAPSAAASRAGG